MGAPVCLEYRIEGNDFMVAGAASNNIKNTLKMLGIDSGICRRVAIITYEAEINLVIHAGGGMLKAEIYEDHVVLIAEDQGPGIADISKAMTEGFTTASDQAREMGFGAGMGLPNIKRNSDVFNIESEVGVGTKVKAIFKTDSIDYTPLGDIDSTVIMLITMNTDRNFIYRLKVDEKEFTLSTSELKGILGDVPLNEPSVTQWIKEYLHEQTQTIRGGVL